MRYLLLFSLIFFSCNHLPRDYRKMERNIRRKEIIERRNQIEIDTTHFRWYPLSDSAFIGTPKLLR